MTKMIKSPIDIEREKLDEQRRTYGEQKLFMRRVGVDKNALYRDRMQYAERMYSQRHMPNWLAVLPADAVDEIRLINVKIEAINRRDEALGMEGRR